MTALATIVPAVIATASVVASTIEQIVESNEFQKTEEDLKVVANDITEDITCCCGLFKKAKAKIHSEPKISL
jgi:hypothetical protein